MSAPLSVLVMTKNEERNIAACLDSVAGWASDIVVVDSGSVDRTLELCAARGVPTVFHEYTDHRSQLRWSMTGVPWKHDWLLVLDSDHIVTPEFRAAVDRMLEGDTGAVHGYFNPHVQIFQNCRVRGLKGSYLQLIRRSRTHVDESELVDYRLVVDGPVGTLPGAIIEDNQNELDIDFWIDKHQRFARRMAIEEILRAEGALGWSAGLRPRLMGSPDERMIWFKNVWYRLPLYIRPVLYFVYRYVLRLGFLDGRSGFVFHALQAFWFRLVVDLHIARFRRQLAARETSVDELISVARGGRNNRG